MARKRKPKNETEDEGLIRQTLETVSNVANRSEKTSWNRKMNNMVKLMSKLTPIENKILELQAQKEPLLDQVAELRGTMIHECIHPFEYLVYKEDHILCKFCERRLSLPRQ